MSKECPIKGIAIYADCLECDNKICKKEKYDKIVIGIDQSYKNVGISIAADGKLLKVKSLDLNKIENNSIKRKTLDKTLEKIINNVVLRSDNIVCIIERIRLRSQGFLNIDYIKSIGALNSVIVDKFEDYGIPVFSVDTRCWKSQVVGTSKPAINSFGVPEEKWPTVEWLINQGWEKSILKEVKNKRKNKGTFIRDGIKYSYDNDAADSAGIAMFGFLGEKDKLKEEK